MPIPKIIHRIWLGSELPKRYDYDFRSIMPDWTINLWTEDSLAKELNILDEHYNTAWNMSNKANAARIEILYRYGGVYFDTDVIPLRSLDPLIVKDFFAAWEVENSKHLIGCAVFGTIPRGSIISELLLTYQKDFDPFPGTPSGQVLCSGPGLFTQVVRKYPEAIIPTDLLYPIHYGEPPDVMKAGRLNSYTVHTWEGSWKIDWHTNYRSREHNV